MQDQIWLAYLQNIHSLRQEPLGSAQFESVFTSVAPALLILLIDPCSTTQRTPRTRSLYPCSHWVMPYLYGPMHDLNSFWEGEPIGGKADHYFLLLPEGETGLQSFTWPTRHQISRPVAGPAAFISQSWKLDKILAQRKQSTMMLDQNWQEKVDSAAPLAPSSDACCLLPPVEKDSNVLFGSI